MSEVPLYAHTGGHTQEPGTCEGSPFDTAVAGKALWAKTSGTLTLTVLI